MTTTSTETMWAESAARFAGYADRLEITVLKDEGFYRHLEFGPRGRAGWFELVTWPGYLAINGDLSGFVFGCIGDDAFPVFRQADINPGYWAEKIRDGAERVKSYSGDLLRSELTSQVENATADYPGIVEAFAEFLDTTDLCADREDALSEATYFGTGLFRGVDRFYFMGIEDSDWVDWDSHYLHACHAIRWGIAQYDAARGTKS